MLVKYHITIGAIVSTIIYIFFQITFLQALIIFLSSFLIDADHYLYYTIKNKNPSLKKAHKWFLKKRKKWVKLTKEQKQKYKHVIIIFHGIEFIIFIGIISIYIPIFIYILIGILIHLTLDFIELIYYKDKIYSKISQIYTHQKNKTKKEFLI